MNKTELLAQLEGRLGSRGAAVAALDSVLGEIQQAVAAGERVTLTGFGTFERVERPARTGRNPRTGAVIEIAASAAPRFHAGSALRAAVAGTAGATATGAGTAASGTATRAARVTRSATAAPTSAATPAKEATSKARSAKVKKKHKTASSDKPGKRSGSGTSLKASAGKKKK